jgi:hypothetical protein
MTQVKEAFLTYFKTIYQNDKDFGILNSFLTKVLKDPKEDHDIKEHFLDRGSKLNVEMLCEELEEVGLISFLHQSNTQTIYKISDLNEDEETQRIFTVTKGESLKVNKDSVEVKKTVSISEKKETTPLKKLTDEEIDNLFYCQ